MWIIYFSVIAMVIGAAEFDYTLDWNLPAFASKFQTRQTTPVQLVCVDNVQLLFKARQHVQFTSKYDIGQTNSITSILKATSTTTFQVNTNAFIEYIPERKYCTSFCVGISIEMTIENYSSGQPQSIKQRKDAKNENKMIHVLHTENLNYTSDKTANRTMYYEMFKDFIFRKLSDSFQNELVQHRFRALLGIVGATLLFFVTVKTVKFCEKYIFLWSRPSIWINLHTVFMVLLLTCTIDARRFIDQTTAIQPSMEYSSGTQQVNTLKISANQTKTQESITFSSVITEGQIKLENTINSDSVNYLETVRHKVYQHTGDSTFSTPYLMLKDSSIVNSGEKLSVNQKSDLPLSSSNVITSSSVTTLASIYNSVFDAGGVYSRHIEQSSYPSITYAQLTYPETFIDIEIPSHVPEQPNSEQISSLNSQSRNVQDDTAIELEQNNKHNVKDIYTNTLNQFNHYSKIANIDATQTFGSTSDDAFRIFSVDQIFKTDKIEEQTSEIKSVSSENMDVEYSSNFQTMSLHPSNFYSVKLDSIDQKKYQPHSPFISHSSNIVSQYAAVLQINSSLAFINSPTEHLHSIQQSFVSSFPKSKDLTVLAVHSDATFDIKKHLKSLDDHSSLEVSPTLYSYQPSKHLSEYEVFEQINPYSYNDDHSYLSVDIELSMKDELKINGGQTENILRASFRVGAGSDSTTLEERTLNDNSHTLYLSAGPLEPSYKSIFATTSNSKSTTFQISSRFVGLISDKSRSSGITNVSIFASTDVTSLSLESQPRSIQMPTLTYNQPSLHSYRSPSSTSYTNQQFPLVSTTPEVSDQHVSDKNYLLHSISTSTISNTPQMNTIVPASQNNDVYSLHAVKGSQINARDEKKVPSKSYKPSHLSSKFSIHDVRQTSSISSPSIVENESYSERLSKLPQFAGIDIDAVAENKSKHSPIQKSLSSAHLSTTDIHPSTSFSTIYDDDKIETSLQQISRYVARSDISMDSLNVFKHSISALKTQPLSTVSSSVLISAIPTRVASYQSTIDTVTFSISHSKLSFSKEPEMASFSRSELLSSSILEIVPPDFGISDGQKTQTSYYLSGQISSEIISNTQTVLVPFGTSFRTPSLESSHSTKMQPVELIESDDLSAGIGFKEERSEIKCQSVSKSLMRNTDYMLTSIVSSTTSETSNYFSSISIVSSVEKSYAISSESGARSFSESFSETIDTHLSSSMKFNTDKHNLQSPQSLSQIPLSVSQNQTSFDFNLKHTAIFSNSQLLTDISISDTLNTAFTSTVQTVLDFLSSTPDLLSLSFVPSSSNYFISSAVSPKNALSTEPIDQSVFLYSSIPIENRRSTMYKELSTFTTDNSDLSSDRTIHNDFTLQKSPISRSASQQSLSSLTIQNTFPQILQTVKPDRQMPHLTSDISDSTSFSPDDFVIKVDTSEILPVTLSSIQISNSVKSVSSSLVRSSDYQSLESTISLEEASLLNPSYETIFDTGSVQSAQTNEVTPVISTNFTSVRTELPQEHFETFRHNASFTTSSKLSSRYIPYPDNVVSALSIRKDVTSKMSFSITKRIDVETTNSPLTAQTDQTTPLFTLHSSVGSGSFSTLLSDLVIHPLSFTSLHLLRSTKVKDRATTPVELSYQSEHSQVSSFTHSETVSVFDSKTPTNTGSDAQSVNTFNKSFSKFTEVKPVDDIFISASSNSLVSLTSIFNKDYQDPISSSDISNSIVNGQNLFSSFSIIPFSSDLSLATPTLHSSSQSITNQQELSMAYHVSTVITSSESKLREFILSEISHRSDKLQTSAEISKSVQDSITVSKDKSSIDASLLQVLSYPQAASSTSSFQFSVDINSSPSLNKTDNLSSESFSSVISEAFYQLPNETVMSVENPSDEIISIPETSSNSNILSSITSINYHTLLPESSYIPLSYSTLHSFVPGVTNQESRNTLHLERFSHETSNAAPSIFQDHSLTLLTDNYFVSYSDEALHQGKGHSISSDFSSNKEYTIHASITNIASAIDNSVNFSDMFSSYQTENESSFPNKTEDFHSTELPNSYISIETSSEMFSFQPYSGPPTHMLSTSFTNLLDFGETTSSKNSDYIRDSLSSSEFKSSTFKHKYTLTPYLTKPPTNIIPDSSSFIGELSESTTMAVSSTGFEYIPSSDALKSIIFNSNSNYSLSSNQMSSISLSITGNFNLTLTTSAAGSISNMPNSQSSVNESEQSMHINITKTITPETTADHSTDLVLNVTNSVINQNDSGPIAASIQNSLTQTLLQETNGFLALRSAISNINDLSPSPVYGISTTAQNSDRDSDSLTAIFTVSSVKISPAPSFSRTEHFATNWFTSSSYQPSDVQANESRIFSEADIHSKSEVLSDSEEYNNTVGSKVSEFDMTNSTFSSSIYSFVQTSRVKSTHVIDTSFTKEPVPSTSFKSLETLSKLQLALSETPTNIFSERTLYSISSTPGSTISASSIFQQNIQPQYTTDSFYEVSDSSYSYVAASFSTLSMPSKHGLQVHKSMSQMEYSAENGIVSDTVSLYEIGSQQPEKTTLFTNTDLVSVSHASEHSSHEALLPSFTAPLTSQSIVLYDTEDTTQVHLEKSYFLNSVSTSFSNISQYSSLLANSPSYERNAPDLTLTLLENISETSAIETYSKSTIKLDSSCFDLGPQSSKPESSSVTESSFISVDPVISSPVWSELLSSDYVINMATDRSVTEMVSEFTTIESHFSSSADASSVSFEQVSTERWSNSIVYSSTTSKQVQMGISSVSISASPVERLTSTTPISTTSVTPTISPALENLVIIGIQVKLTTDISETDFINSVELGLLKCYMEGLEREGNLSPRQRRETFSNRNKRGSHADIERLEIRWKLASDLEPVLLNYLRQIFAAERRLEDTTDVDVRFYVIDGGNPLTGKAAELIFNRLSLVETSALLGYPVARRVVALVSPSTPSPTPAEPFFSPLTIVLIVVPVTLVVIAGIILLCLYCGEPVRSQRTSVPWSISSLRKPTLDDFDLMIDFENGKVVQRGTPTKQTNHVAVEESGSSQTTNALNKDILALQKTLSEKHSVRQKEDRMRLIGFHEPGMCETALDEPINAIQTSTVKIRAKVYGKERKETNNLKSKIDNIYDGRNRNKSRKCHAHMQVCEGQLGLNIPLNSPDVIPENIGTLYKNDNDTLERGEQAYFRDTKQRNSRMPPILTKNESYEVVSETSGIDNDVSDSESFDSKKAYVSGEDTDDCNDNDVELSVREKTEMRVYRTGKMVDNSDSVDDIMRQLRERSPLCKISNGSFRASRLQKHRRSAIINRELVFQGQNDQSNGLNRRHSSTEYMPYSTSRAPKLPVQGYCDKILQKPFYSSLTLGKVPRQVNNFLEGDLEDDVFVSGDTDSNRLNQTNLKSTPSKLNTDMTTPSSIRTTKMCTSKTEYPPLQDASSPDYCVPWDVLGLRFQRQFGCPDGQQYTDGSEYAGDEFESVNFKNEYKNRGRKKNIDQLDPFKNKEITMASEMFQHSMAPNMLDPVTKMSRCYSRQASPKVEFGPQFRPLQYNQIRAQPRREPSRDASPIESFKEPEVTPAVTPEPEMEIHRSRDIPEERRINMQPYEEMKLGRNMRAVPRGYFSKHSNSNAMYARENSQPLISHYPSSDPVTDYMERTTLSPLLHTASDGADFSQFQSKTVYNPQFSDQEPTVTRDTNQRYTAEHQYRQEEQHTHLETSMRIASDHQTHLEEDLRKLKEADNKEAKEEQSRNAFEAIEPPVEASPRFEDDVDVDETQVKQIVQVEETQVKVTAQQEETQVKEVAQEEATSHLTSTSISFAPAPPADVLYDFSSNDKQSGTGKVTVQQESTYTHGHFNYGGETSSNSIISSNIVEFSETTRFSLKQETVDEIEEISEEIEGEENTTEKDKLSDDDFQF